MAALMANGNPVPESNSSSVTVSNPGKQQSKSMVASSKTEAPRKQGNASNDANQRRAPPQKAWTSGMNPITQRSTTPSQQNGSLSQGKPSLKPDSHDSAGGDKVLHERLLFLLANAMGQTTSVTTKNGDIYTGIFFGASMDKSEPEYLLKMVQQVRLGHKGDLNGIRDPIRDYIGVGDDHAMSFKIKEVVDFAPEGISISNQDKRPNGAPSGFQTDTDISGYKAGQARELQPWVAPVGTDIDQPLESSASTGTWDQFQANEHLFGVKSDYDENIYTSRIDRSHPDFRAREAEARRLAHRMGETTTGEVNESGDWDEEDKYSGVKREIGDYPPLQSTQPNRYQPPARRPPSGKPTVPGAPVDPAIISSQIARPDNVTKLEKDPAPDPASDTAARKSLGESMTAQDKVELANITTGQKQQAVNDIASARPAKGPAPNATTNVENDALKAFKQFSEKQKIRMADDRRQRMNQDKNVKLNDLRGFSKTFKLNTPVPSDLVPILAKDKKKQDEIMEKAQRNAAEKAASPVKALPKPIDHAATKANTDSKRDASKAGPGASERSEYPRQGVPPRGPQASLPLRDRQPQPQFSIPTLPANEQSLSHRLAKAQRDRQAGVPVNVPPPLPIHTQKPPSRPSTNAPRANNSQAPNSMRTPTSATSGKFNVKAHEFVPNPSANTFMPTGQPSAASSPKAKAKARSASRASSPSDFFGNKKPLPAADRPSILDNFNPLNRLKEKAMRDGKAKDYAHNGGIAFAHATSVTWTTVNDGEEGKSYKDMFQGPSASIEPSPRPATASPINPNLAHQHQLPAHLQHGSHGTPALQNPPQTIYQGPPPQHLYPGMPQPFDDHRMHASPSVSAYSTPRLQTTYGAYPTSIGQPMQGPIPGPIPGAFQYPPAMGPTPSQIMNPGGPQPPQFRQFSNGPQYMPAPSQQLAAPMMVQQGSQGPYMPQGAPIAHVPVYASGGVPSYGQSQPTSGYPSPGRGAPMMMHQGSYQGQNALMHAGQQYGQPFYSPQPPPPNMPQIRGYSSPQPQQYSQSPQQQYHYPPQPHRMPSHGYGNHAQGPPQLPMQQHPTPGATNEGGEGMK